MFTLSQFALNTLSFRLIIFFKKSYNYLNINHKNGTTSSYFDLDTIYKWVLNFVTYISKLFTSN